MRDVNHGLSQYLSFDRSTSAGRRYRRSSSNEQQHRKRQHPRLFPPSGDTSGSDANQRRQQQCWKRRCAGRVPERARRAGADADPAGDPIPERCERAAGHVAADTAHLHNFDTRYRDRDVGHVLESFKSFHKSHQLHIAPSSSHCRQEPGHRLQHCIQHTDLATGRAQHTGHPGCKPDQPAYPADCGPEPADCRAEGNRAGRGNSPGSAEPTGAESIGAD